MKIEIHQKDTETHQWHLVARFEYGTYAMEAARALSEATGGLFKVIDYRWPDDAEKSSIIYEDGIAS